jgi:hypothetical protein
VIVWSALLTPIAVALLIAGVVTSNLGVMIGALSTSVLAGLFLMAAVRRRRASVPAAPAVPVDVALPDAATPFPPMAPIEPTDDNARARQD